MSILALPHAQPDVILIDWHATLVNTHDAMYHAVDDVLPHLQELGLLERLLTAEQSKTVEDAKLVKYVRDHRRLHPKVVVARKISRTDIFEVLFGDDEDAKRRAHQAFDRAYRQHVGEVTPLEADARLQLTKLRELGIALGLISNRSREFMTLEVDRVEEGGWSDLFDVMVCGDDVPRRKPSPDMLLAALEQLGRAPSEASWYLGDSTTDVIAARSAGLTSLFYNGAGWDQAWLDKIFPGTERHPWRPHAVVPDLSALVALARHLRAQGLRVTRHRDQ